LNILSPSLHNNHHAPVGHHEGMKIFDSIKSPFYKGRFRGIFKGNKIPRPPLEKGVSKPIFVLMQEFMKPYREELAEFKILDNLCIRRL
jgi:hypothetical protein